ncbi:flagellar hook-length control protein FliK [Zhongshania arctica]|uniref:Flagellar hook-length control protein FliK n=1 Tax=Zhongshania arctica TaxID=3238302 RepID=A0ABV3TXC4_9GAMM
MQNSISPALPKVDGSAKTTALSSTGSSDDAQPSTPFNQLLSTAQGATPIKDIASFESAEMTGDQQLSADIDIFSDSLADVGFGGKLMPEGGQGLPFSALESSEVLSSVALQEDSEDGDVLVTWQQSQIDWFRQSTSLVSNQGSTASASLNAVAVGLDLDTNAARGKFSGGENVATTLLSVNDKGSDTKANVALTATVAGDLSKPTTGFATAMQLSSAANALPTVKAAGQPIELKADLTAGLDLLSAAPTRSTDNSAAVRAPVNLTVTQNALTDPAWSQAMAAKISWMGGNGVHSATLQLRPAELGSIHIQLSMQGDTTSVQIQTQHKDTSDLMEKMMPRLHSGMENQGLRLEDVKVSHNPNLNDGGAANSGQQFAGQSAGDRSGAADDGRNGIKQNGLGENGVDGVDDGSSSGLQNATVVLQNSGVDYYA